MNAKITQIATNAPTHRPYRTHVGIPRPAFANAGAGGRVGRFGTPATGMAAGGFDTGIATGGFDAGTAAPQPMQVTLAPAASPPALAAVPQFGQVTVVGMGPRHQGEGDGLTLVKSPGFFRAPAAGRWGNCRPREEDVPPRHRGRGQCGAAFRAAG